jgi:hypothetical protein
MHEVPLWRLHLLRAAYLLIAVGLLLSFGPLLLAPGIEWAQHKGDTAALLGGLACLCLLGVRHPLRMLPLLMFELVWKVIWLLAIGRPLWRAGAVTPAVHETTVAVAVGVLLMLAVLPWRHVWRHYVRQPAERWR